VKLKVFGDRFFLGMAASLVVIAVVWLLLLLGQAGRPVPGNRWIEQAYQYKLSLANAVNQPKVLVVGGSAAMFGVDSGLMSAALNRPVVNLGVNAGVLSPFIQHYARQAIKPGDWVLLPVEYPLFSGRYSISQPFVDYWWTHPGFRRLDVTVPQVAQLIWHTPLSRVLQGYRGIAVEGPVTGLYGPQNLDARGDQINSDASQQEIWMKELVTRSPVERYGAQARPWEANWASWKSLADEIEAAGGCAVFVPPPMLDRPAYHHGKEGRFYASFAGQARAQGLNYVGSALQTLYPMERFLDTNYHLNAASRQVYTRHIIELVKPAFAKCGGAA